MNYLIEKLSQPWPWYVAGPLIGLTIPFLLLIGNKAFGISASMRHICAACLPAKIPFFQYDWKKEVWNLFFVGGVFAGGIIAAIVLASPDPIQIDDQLRAELYGYGVTNISSLMPTELFNVNSLLTVRGFFLMIVGGFLVGFGTRYGGGCTSGHAIMGISSLQIPSIIATCCFMAGGFIMANFILPFILTL
ncbi:MAG: YeeE/YedE family protein [Cyclobacteriaceae bacterium]|nr:YeeE/YedE family protein [Cyclobacteriaceae bacterium]